MTTETAFILAEATTEADYAAAKDLFVAYQQFLGVDLCFQSFDAELQQLPDMYGPPHGCLILATRGNTYAGCVALRNKGNGICEMKRLYVPDNFQGHGLGRQLATAIVEKAKTLGYQKMVLDTLDRLQPAIALYRSLGFVETGAYYANPLQGVVYMEFAL